VFPDGCHLVENVILFLSWGNGCANKKAADNLLTSKRSQDGRKYLKKLQVIFLVLAKGKDITKENMVKTHKIICSITKLMPI
jgi:hypothetical protein